MSPTFTVGSFFRRVRSTFLFICSTTSTRTTDVHNILVTPENARNKNIDDCTKGFPFRLFRHFATQWMSKNPKGSPFYMFWQRDTVQKSQFQIFFGIFFKSPEDPYFNFFIFCNQLRFHKSQKVRFLQISALCIAPTLAVPGVFYFTLINDFHTSLCSSL